MNYGKILEYPSFIQTHTNNFRELLMIISLVRVMTDDGYESDQPQNHQISVW